MIRRIENAADCAGRRIRALLLAVAGNESLFFFASFMSTLLFGSEMFTWHYSEAIRMILRYVIVPWGMAMCLLRLERRSRMELAPQRWDVNILFVLLLWIVVPFALRFGMTYENTKSWIEYSAVFFGLYAMITEQAAEQRERVFDQACAIMGVFSLVLGGALMYCALTGARIDSGWVLHYGTYTGAGFGFGVFNGAHLCAGIHYNVTGMTALCCMMFSLAGLCRSKNSIMRFAYLLATVFMVILVVLTQSRTARYALVAALGVGVYGRLAASGRIRNGLLRHTAGMLAAAAVMVTAFAGASMLTDAALAHYANVANGNVVSAIPAAIAEESAEKPEAQHEVQAQEARAAVDATLSQRTTIWKNLFQYWRSHPKEMLIGAGMGRIGEHIVENTVHEEIGSVGTHNTYLQFMADFGLIGIGLLALFFAVILLPVLRVFYAGPAKRIPGYHAMCMLVVGVLLTGLMESAPLGAMTPTDSALFFALALLAPRGMEIKA